MSGVEAYLWATLVVFWGVGDTATTYIAVERYGGVESNPVPRRVFDRFGAWSMLPMKAVGIGLIYVSWRALEGSGALRLVALGSVATLGVAVTAWNGYQILVARGRGRSTKPL